jgi:hypothetical protein
MATAIIVLVSTLCGVCGVGMAVAIALVSWPESTTQAKAEGMIAKEPVHDLANSHSARYY